MGVTFPAASRLGITRGHAHCTRSDAATRAKTRFRVPFPILIAFDRPWHQIGNNPRQFDRNTRVWTQLIHNLMAKMWIMARKLRLSFSKRVASLRMSFIVQMKRSTMLRIL